MTSTLELSRPVRLDTLGDAPREVAVVADEAERAALARRFGLLALAELRATVDLRQEAGRIACTGRLYAQAIQACVASGEPVPAVLDEDFALAFVPAQSGRGEEEVELDAADLDLVEYDGAAVDVGEAVAQTLGLALDPFPRASGADAALRAAGVIDEDAAGPFGALKALRDRL